MEPVNLELLKKRLNKMLGREVGIEKLRTGKFICKYMDYNMSPLSLVGETEEEAYQKLAAYLQAKTAESFDDPPTSA
jgi:hypothetical protein